MTADSTRSNSNGAVMFALGVLVGAVSGGIAGWIVSGHLATLATAILHLVDRDHAERHVHFEAMQQ